MQENGAKADIDSLRIDPKMKENPVKKGKWPLIFALLAVIVIAALALLVLKKGPVTVSLTTVQAAKGDRDNTVLTASGYVEARRKATVAAKITGQIKELFVEEGMQVKAGQVLARLDDAEAKARYESAQADLQVARSTISELQVSLENAARTLKRKRELREARVIGQEEFDLAETEKKSLEAQLKRARDQVEAARAAVEVARQMLDHYTIRAPFSGIAISKDAQVGEMVSPISAGGGYTRTGISTIVDMSSLEIEVDVNESHIAKVGVGQPVTAVLDAYPDWQIPARVRTIIPSADRQKATVKVRILFDKLHPRILPDMGIKVYFLAQEAAGGKTALPLLPKTAVLEEKGKQYVFVFKDGRVEKRAISVGSWFEKQVEISAGLRAGDQVVTDHVGLLKEGQKVRKVK